MARDECLNVAEDRRVLHGATLSRVITRMSMQDTGIHTILRAATRSPIAWLMAEQLAVDMDRLRADMATEVERTSARAFSLAATGRKNPDFYRNFVNDGQDKRLSAEVYLGIVHALGRDPLDYVIGWEAPVRRLPNEVELTAALTMLLPKLGVDPNENGRARKLAVRLPAMLQQIAEIGAFEDEDSDEAPVEVVPPLSEDRPTRAQ